MKKTTNSRSQNTKLGVLFGVIAAFSFALMSVFVKQIGDSLPTSMVIFFRFGISLVFLIPFIVKEPDFSFKVNEPGRYLIRILASLSGLFCIFYVIKFIPLVDALLLNNTAPLFVPMVAWLLIGAKTPRAAWIGIMLGFVGVAIVLRPGQEIFSLISLIALASGLLTAIAIVQIRLITKTSSTKQMLFYYFLVSTLITGVSSLIEWKTPPNIDTWMLLLIIGILGTVYQVSSTLSYASAPIRLMSSLFFLTIVFGGFFDWLVWNHVPDLFTIIGALFIIIGAIITVYFGQKALLRK